MSGEDNVAFCTTYDLGEMHNERMPWLHGRHFSNYIQFHG